MLVSVFRDERDNVPARGEVSWDQLVAELARVRAAPCSIATCERSDCPHKYGEGWSPAYWPVGAKRRVDNVEGVSALIIDLDHVPPGDLVGVLARVQPFRHFIHASHSDRPDDRCLRVGIALTRPVAGRDWPRFWRAAIAALGLPADGQTKDASRLFFSPSRPQDACAPTIDGTGYAFGTGEGGLLDVDALLATAPADIEPEPTFVDYAVPDFTGAPDEDRLDAAARALAAAWPSTRRHQAQLALAGALARSGWPVELIAQFCMAVAELHEPGNGKLHKRLSAARSSVEKVAIGAAIQGWPSVEEHVGVDVVNVVRRILGMRVIEEAGDAAIQSLMARFTPPPAPSTSIDDDAHFKSVQKRLAARKDVESLRDAELLRRVNAGDFLTDSASDDPKVALCYAALAVARAAPAYMTPEQIAHRLAPSAGALAADVPEVVALAVAQAREMPHLMARQTAGPASAAVAAPDEFVLKKTGEDAGTPLASAEHNFRVALNKLSVTLRYNAFAHQEIVARECANGSVQEQAVEDHHVDTLAFEIERTFGFYPPVDKFFRFINTAARECQFHPVLDYLARVDAEAPTETGDLTETWLIRYADAEDTPYVRAVSRLTLVAAVRRVRRPGAKFDELLVLEGTQGHGKSSALRSLVPDESLFSDGLELGTDAKVIMEQTAGKWIVEVPEMHTRGADSKVKAMLSRQDDSARGAYRRKSETRRRHFIPVGTTNEEQYLFDRTGNRRYWPVRVGEIDVEGLIAARDALWAEASALEASGFSIRLPRELWPAAAAEQDKRKVDDPYQIILEDAFGDQPGHVRIQDVWKVLGFHEERQPSRNEQMQIAQVMQALSFHRERRQVGGSRAWYYERGDAVGRDVLLTVQGSSGSGFRVRATAAPPPQLLAAAGGPPTTRTTN